MRGRVERGVVVGVGLRRHRTKYFRIRTFSVLRGGDNDPKLMALRQADMFVPKRTDVTNKSVEKTKLRVPHTVAT